MSFGCFITQGTYIKNPSRNSSSHTLSRKVTQNRLLLGGHSVRHNSALMARLIYFLIFTPLVEAAVLVFRTLFETRSWKTLKLLWRPFDKTGDEAQVGTHTASQESFARIRPDDCSSSNSSKQQLGQATKRSPELYEHTSTTEGRRASFTRSFNHLLFHRPHYYVSSYVHIRPMRHQPHRISSCPTDFRVFNSSVQVTTL